MYTYKRHRNKHGYILGVQKQTCTWIPTRDIETNLYMDTYKGHRNKPVHGYLQGTQKQTLHGYLQGTQKQTLHGYLQGTQKQTCTRIPTKKHRNKHVHGYLQRTQKQTCTWIPTTAKNTEVSKWLGVLRPVNQNGYIRAMGHRNKQVHYMDTIW